VTRPADPAGRRREFLDRRRRTTRENFDRRWAGIYDDDWGSYLNPTHERTVRRLVRGNRPGRLLDAACGTGKYWPLLLDVGVTVTGVDQSEQMLRRARAKHPSVPVAVLGLQELACLRTRTFDRVMCVDAIECVGPEDWPVVVDGLAGATRPGGTIYLTVEDPDPDEEVEPAVDVRDDEPLVAGELLFGTAYHFYPQDSWVDDRLAERGLQVLLDERGHDYRHLLLRVP
jgi:SAM-dependent methyltransferase